MIDTHSHIYCDQFDDDRDATVLRAQEAGISHIILPNENLASVPLLRTLHDQYPAYTSMALGLHPEEVKQDWREVLDAMRPLLDTGDFIAVGEIGIDLYWDKTYRLEQMDALAMQLQWCTSKDLPFIMHCRDGLDEVLQVFDTLGTTLPRGVFHCWPGDAGDVERVRRYGDFYFGIGGVVTFKKSHLPAVLPAIGLDRILLETDAPYMAPVPMRGKRNESSFIPYINNHIATILGVTPEEVSAVTDRNARDLFKIN
ncbi:MAG: TatD family hydrolase [Bacteroidales bacterium]|nr:TatD family hydrolase [Candidatus Sodaliphilus limicaballi]